MVFLGCLVFLGQLVMVIGVFCVVVAPFCAVMVVGICGGVVVVCLVVLVMCLVCPWRRMVTRLWVVVVVVGLQRLPFVVSAECGPWGRIVWKDVTGASGMVSNLE